MAGQGRPRLTRDDWTAAALRALAAGGTSAVAIEPLAATLGATKGSGYWHFADRADLLAATLARWEHDHTDLVIAQLERSAPAEVRLRELFGIVMNGTQAHSVELALLASAADPTVAGAVQRVTDRRLEYLAGLFGELGFDRDEAPRRALLAYTSYLGFAQLARNAPAALPPAEQQVGYLGAVLAALTRR